MGSPLYHSKVYQKGMQYVIDNANKMVVVKGVAASYNDANNLDTDAPAGFKVGEIAMAPADFTYQAHSPDGFEVVVAAKNLAALDDSLISEDHHVCLLNTTLSELLVRADITPELAIGNPSTIQVPSWLFFFRAPVNS